VQARTFVMFLAGAIIGFFFVWYYVDLFGLFGYRSSRGYGLVVGAAGALLLGIISAFFIRAVAIFAAATVIGYVVSYSAGSPTRIFSTSPTARAARAWR
jgi:hypothetical protein